MNRAFFFGRLAQLGEHRPYKARVTSSSLVAPTKIGVVVQLVRIPACHAGGRGFESRLLRHYKEASYFVTKSIGFDIRGFLLITSFTSKLILNKLA